MIGRKNGRLKKGGDPDRFMAAVSVLNAFQRGKLPWFVAPPDLKEDEEPEPTKNKGKGEEEEDFSKIKGINLPSQDMNNIEATELIADEGDGDEGEGEGESEVSDDDDDEDFPVVLADGEDDAWD